MLKDTLESGHLLLLPLIAAVGAFAREIVGWLRGARRDRSDVVRSDMEVGRALRDELHEEIERLRMEIARQDAECQRRLDEMDMRLKSVSEEAERAADEAGTMRAEATRLAGALKEAQQMIRALKRQVLALTKATG